MFGVLERAYERLGRFDKLGAIIKQRLVESRDEAEIRRLRLRSAEISGGQLGDALGAYAAIEAAFLQEPEDTSLWEKLSAAAERAKYLDFIGRYSSERIRQIALRLREGLVTAA